MQAIKLTIPGRFWDSQLYKQRLYLFTLEGSLQVLDWDRLIQDINVQDTLRVALECAFQRSDYFYSAVFQKLRQDQDVTELLISKFSELASCDLACNSITLQRSIINESNTPFPFAHNDSLIYSDQFYAASQGGVYASSIFDQSLPKTASTITQKRQKLWDAPVSSMDVHQGVLALAAGEPGLFRALTSVDPKPWIDAEFNPRNIWNQLCNDCNYVSSSVLATGFESEAGLIEFRSPKQDPRKTNADLATEYWQTPSIGTVEGREIFGTSTRGGFVWGSKDRICMAKDHVLHVTKYQSTNPNRKSVAKKLRDIQLQEWKGDAVSGDNAVFGAILELDNCILVIRSDDKVDTLVGEPTNWRVFPRSRYYTNQLHVIYDDHMEVHSFNHDFFLNQKEKVLGEQLIERKLQ